MDKTFKQQLLEIGEELENLFYTSEEDISEDLLLVSMQILDFLNRESDQDTDKFFELLLKVLHQSSFCARKVAIDLLQSLGYRETDLSNLFENYEDD